MRYILYLCWKTFIKGGYWIYFGVSFLLGMPFIQWLSVLFNLPFKTGDFHYKPVLLFLALWYFLLQICEIVNMIITRKFNYNSWNVFWGLCGFIIALFLMR